MMQNFTSKTILFFLTYLFLSTTLQSQTGCPGCLTNLPSGLPDDTIYLDDLPDGTINVPYDADLSFRMPKTTTAVAAVDSTVIPGLTLDEIRITGIGNLPPGLQWEASQEVFNLSNETDGCAKFCGTPILPGVYVIEIFLEVKIAVITQTTSFEKTIVINGGNSVNDGFTMMNSVGCGEVEVSFQNNVPSNGNSGIAYLWDFGNGNTSLNENPTTQTYSTPGSYPVNYQAVVDTVGYFLTNVTVTNTDCNDIFSATDLYLVLEDPNGNEISTPNVWNTNAPVDFNLNYEIGPVNYTLTVMDEDGGIDGGDDICGVFTINQLSNGQMSSGSTGINITIIHPTETIETSDTVHVYPIPTQPEIMEFSFEQLCAGDEFTLTSNVMTNNQWNLDGVEILNAIDQTYVATQTGIYSVTTTNDFGCSATSENVELIFHELPPAPQFTDDGTNLLALNSNFEILPQFAFQWYYENTLITNATDPTLCIDESGLYTLEVINTETGCLSFFTGSGTFDDMFFCGEVDVNELLENSLKVFPNPFQNEIFVELNFNESTNLTINLIDVLGRKTLLESENNINGFIKKLIDVTSIDSGVYFLEIVTDEQTVLKKIIKQ